MSTSNERLREAIRHALNGEAILFLGAGASRSARGPKGNALPVGSELSRKPNLRSVSWMGHTTFGSIAEYFVQKHSETRLINALRRHLKVTKISDQLEVIATLPWNRIWTSNYDDVIEQALTVNNVNYHTMTTADDVANARGNKLLIVHINGALTRLRQSITADFILTSQSYATNAFVESVWSKVFRQDLHAAKSIIFIGYSLYDVDVSRLLFNPTLILRKKHIL